MDRTRRGFIAGTAALGASQLAGCSSTAEQSGWDGREPVTRADLDRMVTEVFARGRFTCVRALQSNEGPFYYESSPRRRDIAEGRNGIPLRLGVRIANALLPGNACAPLAGAVVDVWHTDADGIYSNVGADLQNEDTVGQTFLRGNQVVDADGYVEFDTVVPGWELVTAPLNVVIRTTHIHVKVFHENQVLTAQLYFPDEFIDELYASTDPYRTHHQMTAPGADRMFDRIRNGDDPIFVADQSAPMQIERQGDLVIAQATIGLVSVGSKGAPSLFR